MIRDAILLPFERTRAAKVMTGAIAHMLRREPIDDLGRSPDLGSKTGDLSWTDTTPIRTVAASEGVVL